MTPALQKTTEDSSRLARVDGLRAAAILGVIAVHSGMAFGSPTGLTDLGKHGVELFFLISGFILVHVASRAPFDAGRFFIKRFFRLAPLYYLVLAACYLVGFNEHLEAGVAARGNDLANALWHLTFLHGLHPRYVRSIYSVSWSLTPEVVFYLLFPLLLRLDTRRLLAVLAGCAAMSRVFPALAVALLGYSPAVSIWARHSPMFTLYLFIFGMLVYRHERFFRGRFWAWTGIAAITCFILQGAGVGLGPAGRLLDVAAGDREAWFLALMFPMLVYSNAPAARRLLDNRPIAFLGKISYSAFFVHLAVVHACLAWWPGRERVPYVVGAAAVLAITVPLSWLGFLLVEQGGIRLGRMAMDRLPRKVARKVSLASA